MAKIELTAKANDASVNVIQGTKLKAGDTLPPFQCYLMDDGTGVNIADKTPKVHMKKQDADSKLIDGKEMSVLDAEKGKVEYQWDATDTDTQGEFDLEVVVEDTNGNERTFPIDGFVTVVINEDLQ